MKYATIRECSSSSKVLVSESRGDSLSRSWRVFRGIWSVDQQREERKVKLRALS